MLIVTDSLGLLEVYRTVSDAKDDLECQDVERGEYEVVDHTGRIYEFVVHRHTFDIRPTSLVDPDLPMAYLRRFAGSCGLDSVAACSSLSGYDDWRRCLDDLSAEIWRRERQRRRRSGPPCV